LWKYNVYRKLRRESPRLTSTATATALKYGAGNQSHASAWDGAGERRGDETTIFPM